ncbi:MAG: tRNA-dihydrouridine synthase family protein [Muribaculaceae bacterium]|nr:tRNA-dihydrouridine synthase family protein [Muribaculaceae bacterium]MDE6028660.1 tRNA-dihydrouridine synthase family protein [Muribaculaceae bacterium]
MFIAPVQGHTDAAWRHFHKEVYGGDNIYYTPFIRLERGEFRKHDLKDFLSPLNSNHAVIPQVIFRNMEELEPLISGLIANGAKAIDLNTGCPFPLQTAKGRGAAFVGNAEEYSKLPDMLARFPEVDFSLKMRLGFSDPEEWRGIIEILNRLPLRHVTLHPRVAKDQYKGDLRLEEFSEFLKESKNPVIYNGDLHVPSDFESIKTRFPEAAGIMSGRGVLARPSLIAEVESGEEWSRAKRVDTMLDFHNRLFDLYSGDLTGGEHQVLAKIKPFWEYAEEEIGRKAWKAISKASNMAKYQTALAMIE